VNETDLDQNTETLDLYLLIIIVLQDIVTHYIISNVLQNSKIIINMSTFLIM